MTEKDVAKAANIAQPFYHNIEHGIKNPSPKTAQKIGNFLKFDWKMFYES